MKLRTILLTAALLALPAAVQAGVKIDVQQSGSSVLITGAGSFDTTGLTALSQGGVGGAYTGASPALGVIRLGNSVFVPASEFTSYSISGPANFGNGGPFQSATTSSGDVLSIDGFGSGNGPNFSLPSSYVSNSNLSSQISFANTTIAALGFTIGSYVFSTSSDNLTVNVLAGNAGGVTSAVPEPASWAMMIGGFGAVGGALRRRRRLTVAYA